jgi:hypothetical protein
MPVGAPRRGAMIIVPKLWRRERRNDIHLLDEMEEKTNKRHGRSGIEADRADG